MLTTKEEIIAWLDEMKISDYVINNDLTIDVMGDVNLYNQDLDEIPVQFNKVSGFFACHYNNLKSLKGVPEIVGGYFSVRKNKLTSLKYFPKEIGGSIFLQENKLISLKGIISIVNGDFSCEKNNIKSFKYAPKEIKGLFNFSNNPVHYLDCNKIKVETSLVMTHPERIPELEEYYYSDGKTLSISTEAYKKNIIEYERELSKIGLMKNLSIILEKHEEKSKLKL